MCKKVRQQISFTAKKINVMLKGILILLFGILIVLVTANVILRYIFQTPLFAVTELANYLLVYLVFLGAAVALYQNEHVHIEIDNFRIPETLRNVIHKIGIILNCFFIIILVVNGIRLAFINRSSFTGVLAIPMGIVYAVIPISGLMMIIQYSDLLLSKKGQGTP